MIKYLYHRVPKDLRGNVLHPLTTLKDTEPEVYKHQSSKYEGREKVMQLRIDKLNCGWNDVLHFVYINPKLAYDERRKYGGGDRTYKYFKIPMEDLDKNKAVVYKYTTKVVDGLNQNDFVDYDVSNMIDFKELPEATKEYYKTKYENGENPLLWVGVPHVMYKGSLDISNYEIIEV